MPARSSTDTTDRPKPYSDEQVDLLRREAERFRSRCKRLSGKLSWPAFAADVCAHFSDLTPDMRALLPNGYAELDDFTFSGERLRQFVGGVPRAEGERHYPRLEEERLLALDLYLTDPANEHSRLSREQLHGGDWLHAASTLARYFAFQSDELPRLSGSNLCGEFECKRDAHIARLCIEVVQDEENVFRASIMMSGTMIDRRAGWMIVSPEDNVLMLLKSRRTQQNFFYVALALNEDVYDANPVNTLVLVECAFPSALDPIDAASDEEIVTVCMNSSSTNLLIFRRKA